MTDIQLELQPVVTTSVTAKTSVVHNELSKAIRENDVLKSIGLVTEENAKYTDPYGSTALHLACQYYCDDVQVMTGEVRYRNELIYKLIRNGANIDAKNGNGETPLYTAFKNKRYDIASVLLVAGAHI